MPPNFNFLYISSHPPSTPKNVNSGGARISPATFILYLQWESTWLHDLNHEKLLNQESEMIGCDLGLLLVRGTWGIGRRDTRYHVLL